MTDRFEQISLKTGFMKHNGGVLFRQISVNHYEFKSKITKTRDYILRKKILATYSPPIIITEIL